MPSAVDEPRSLKSRLFARKSRPETQPQGRKTLSKRRGPDEPPSYTSIPQPQPSSSRNDSLNDQAAPPPYERSAKLTKPNPVRRTLKQDLLDKDTGERKDVTDLLHSLNFDENRHETFEDLLDDNGIDPTRPLGNGLLARLDAGLWARISSFLDPAETAALATCCHSLLDRLDSPFAPLHHPENKQVYRDRFLLQLDPALPFHLYCFPCSAYHTRTHPGKEVLNPLFTCPNATNALLPPPRTRLTPNRLLPFSFLQLLTRAHRLGPHYGIPAASLGRRWKDPSPAGWSHTAQYHVHSTNAHVLLRVTSQTFIPADPATPAALRLLLYSREDYTPYFSVCAHWRDGVLMRNAKCAVRHIPAPSPVDALHDVHARIRPARRPLAPVALCGDCAPMRRCPECPTEYLIELKLVEDREVPESAPGRFRRALVVTRWSDLGDGISPAGPEWSAVNGLREGYDSFAEIGNRAVSGVFESAFTDTLPGQRILSLNPDGVKKGEKGNDWY